MTELTEAVSLTYLLFENRRREKQTFCKTLLSKGIKKDLGNDATFSTVIRLSLNDYGVSAVGLANVLGVSAAAVSRWATGKNAPPPYARPHIVEAIALLLEEQFSKDGVPSIEADDPKHIPSDLPA